MTGHLIVGLDVSTRGEAETIVTALDGVADFFKIGYQLFYGGDGLALGKDLLAAGKRVFFDLKLLDIDNTVEKGVAAIAETGATMLTVHAYPKTMARQQRARRARTCRPRGHRSDLDGPGRSCRGRLCHHGVGLVALRTSQARDVGHRRDRRFGL